MSGKWRFNTFAHLLVGDGAVELGDGRRVVSVAFQQAPDYPVDDLVVAAGRPEEREPSLLLALGVRRKPNLVLSDESTQKLIREFVRAVINAPTGGPEQRLGLVVAGPQQHAEQLSELTSLAAAQIDAPGLFDLVGTPNKFGAGIRGRLDHLEGLVGACASGPWYGRTRHGACPATHVATALEAQRPYATARVLQRNRLVGSRE